MKFFSTLRGKLTLLFFISTATIAVIVISLLLLTTQKLISQQVNHHLHIVVHEAKDTVENSEHVNPETLQNLVSAQGMTIILLSSDGTPILQTNSVDVADVTQHQMQQIIFSSTDKQEPKHFSVHNMDFATVPV